MNNSLLFAIDEQTQEVIVSGSSEGSNKVNLIERIKHSDNVMLYNAVITLKSISKSSNFDLTIFKSMDKICQVMYRKHKKINKDLIETF